MSASTVPKLLTKLRKNVASGSDKKVWSTCNKLRDAGCAEAAVDRARVVALLHLHQYATLLKELAAYDPEVRQTLQFEEAYALYQVGNFEEALRIQASQQAAQPCWLHLKAQILYKTGDYAGSAEIYESFPEQARTQEVTVNHCASLILSDQAEHAVDTLEDDVKDNSEEWELAYNVACAMLAVEDPDALERVISLLDSAHATGSAVLQKEGLSPSEIAEELAVVNLQRGVLAQMNGDNAEAKEIYASLCGESGDAATRLAAKHNTLSLRHPRERMFDSLRRSSECVASDQFDACTAEQKRAILSARCTLLLVAGQPADATSAAQRLLAEHPDDNAQLFVAAAKLLESDRKACRELLTARLPGRPPQVAEQARAALRARRQRKKKVRRPKGFDPENPSACPDPDPERWLPRWQRTKYKRIRRKREKAKGVRSGAQGGVDEGAAAGLEVKRVIRDDTEVARNQLKQKAKKGKKGRRKR